MGATMATDISQGALARLSQTARSRAGQINAKTTPKGRERLRLTILYTALAIQTLSAFFFTGELWSEILGLRQTPIPYAYQEVIQILASIGLVIGLLATSMLVRRGLDRMAHLNRQIDVASGHYEDHLRALFGEWRLSPSEQAVAIYAMKGFSNAEIANLRSTTASTVKSQMNAIYRKTGLGNRQQLISFLVEELMAGINPEPTDKGAKAA